MSFAGGVFGLLGFYIGYFSRLSNVIARKLPYITNTHVSSMVYLLICYFIIGLISAIFTIKLIGLQIIIHSPIEVARKLNVGGGYIRLGLSTVSIVLYTLFSLRMFEKRKSIPNSLIWIALLTPSVFGVFQGVRGELLRIGGILFVLWCYARYKTPKLRNIIHFIPMIIAAVFIALILMNWFRIYGTIDVNLMNRDMIYELLWQQLCPFDWAVFVAEQLAQSGNYLFWLPYLYLFIAPIPRAIWPEKPIISLEYLFVEQFESDLPIGSTITLTIPGELHLEMPFIGVLVGMAFLGLVLKVCYEYRNLHFNNWAANMIYSFVYVFTITAFFLRF
jgi:oligosaccharide repeat unit polymerase